MANVSHFNMRFPIFILFSIIVFPKAVRGHLREVYKSVKIPDGPFVPCRMVRVQGWIPPKAFRFQIDLLYGHGHHSGHAIALHINPRFKENHVVLNSRRADKTWDREELGNDMPFRRGTDFEIVVICKPTMYMIDVDGKHLHEFRHRLKPEATHIVFRRHVIIKQITFHDASHLVPDPDLCPVQHHCPEINSAVGCPKGKYCAMKGRDRRCIQQFSENATCSMEVQCLGGFCHNEKCKTRCSSPMTVDRCPAHMFCRLREGSVKMCVRQYEIGTPCVSHVQCLKHCTEGQCSENMCPRPGSEHGCPEKQYCKPHGNRLICAPQAGAGSACSSHAECLNSCWRGKCVRDHCARLFTGYGCPKRHFCKFTLSGNRCVKQLYGGHRCSADIECVNSCVRGTCNANDCPTPMRSEGCEDGYYCIATSTGNVCKRQGEDGARCQSDIDCVHECTAGVCGSGQCPTPWSVIGCPPQSYCRATRLGNVCVRQARDRARCSEDVQCVNSCVAGYCSTNRCPTPMATTGCPIGHHCTAGWQGNRCVKRRLDGSECSDDVECINRCIAGRCGVSECPVSNSTKGCSSQHYCRATPSGNVCLEQSGDGAECTSNVECLGTCKRGECISDECDSVGTTRGCLYEEFCTVQGGRKICLPQKMNGMRCSTNIECASGRCRYIREITVCYPASG